MFMVLWERVAAECSHMKKITAVEASAYPACSDQSSLQTSRLNHSLFNCTITSHLQLLPLHHSWPARGRAAPGPEEARGWAPRSCPRLQMERSSQSWGRLNSHLRNTNTVRQLKGEGVSETWVVKKEVKKKRTESRPLVVHSGLTGPGQVAHRLRSYKHKHNMKWEAECLRKRHHPVERFYENHFILWTYEQHQLPVRIRTPDSGLRMAGACQPQSMTLKHTSQEITTNI